HRGSDREGRQEVRSPDHSGRRGDRRGQGQSPTGRTIHRVCAARGRETQFGTGRPGIGRGTKTPARQRGGGQSQKRRTRSHGGTRRETFGGNNRRPGTGRFAGRR